MADATSIPSIPYTDIGNTCGYDIDYDAFCPYGSGGPDVVYRYVATANLNVDIDLCGSLYDTKLLVYRDGPSNLWACNEDAGCGYSGYQSRIEDVVLGAGHTFYLVVGGYSSEACGDYTLVVTESEPCVVECPAGALHEGEPPCGDDAYDEYNGGCGGLGWTPIVAQAGACATMCGRSCAFHYNGYSYRDTDWYTADAAGGTITVEGTAEFHLQLILIYGINCAYLEYVTATAPPCGTATVTHGGFAPGQEAWIWVGPAVYEGVPDLGYRLEACGIAGEPVPTESTTWGRVKAAHR